MLGAIRGYIGDNKDYKELNGGYLGLFEGRIRASGGLAVASDGYYY